MELVGIVELAFTEDDVDVIEKLVGANDYDYLRWLALA